MAEVRALLGCNQIDEARQSTTAKLTEFEQLEWQSTTGCAKDSSIFHAFSKIQTCVQDARKM